MSFPHKLTLLSAASDYWNAAGSGTPQALERALCGYWNAAGSGTREAQMEQPQALERAQRKWNAAGLACSLAPYPYSKMCELCELCELFVKKLLLKVECAILPDCALLMYDKSKTKISVR